jgi:hypothetical protein
MTSGWLAWEQEIDFFLVPTGSTVGPWEAESQSAVDALRKRATESTFWESLKEHYTEENQAETINYDNVSFVKSICKLLPLY